MDSSELEKSKAPGELKVDEYVKRIQQGESKEDIFEGLPDSFKKGIENRLLPYESKEEQEILDTMETHKIRENLGLVEPVSEKPNVNIEDRKKLQGWFASYELAKIAKAEGIDLSELSREDYVEYAIKNSLAIDDNQLRFAPWQRMATSVGEVVLGNRKNKKEITEKSETDFHRFSFETQQKAATEERKIEEGVRIRQGTKDSNSWLFFGINNGAEDGGDETYKAYLSFKDLNKFNPNRLKDFMLALRDSGYNGDLKTFQDLTEQGVLLNDQIVMHGQTQQDTEIALQVAEEFFGQEISQKSFGKDEVIDGKNLSYSQVLAKKIKESINK